MRTKMFVIVLAAMVAAFWGGTASAFHDGGVAYCEGCHTMHNTTNYTGGTGSTGTTKHSDVQGSTPKTGTSAQYLLIGSDQSSTCLNCHGSGATASGYHVYTQGVTITATAATAPLQFTPGGDFAWINGTATRALSHGSSLQPYRNGHNIVAADFGLTPSPTFTSTPGGGLMSPANLHCNSCHDPHTNLRRVDATFTFSTTGAPISASGSYPTAGIPGGTIALGNNQVSVPASGTALGAYRLLAGQTHTAATETITYSGVPVAIAPSSYNQAENSQQVRVAYGDGTGGTKTESWSAWCATCHPNFGPGNKGSMHPIDQNMNVAAGNSTIVTNYNTYIASGNMTGSQATSFTSLVPFASVGSDTTGDFNGLAALADNSGVITTGPVNGDEVMCLSCHRAHASAFPHMMRWNNEQEMITDGTAGWPSTGDSATYGYNSTLMASAYYGRAPVTTGVNGTTNFGVYQRSLCNKCHAWD